MTERREYKVTVTHPTGFHKGTHTLTVTTNYGGHSVYINASTFGCSRDFLAGDDKRAIKDWLAEHACTVVKIVKVK